MCFKTSIAESLEGSHVIDARAGGVCEKHASHLWHWLLNVHSCVGMNAQVPQRILDERWEMLCELKLRVVTWQGNLSASAKETLIGVVQMLSVARPKIWLQDKLASGVWGSQAPFFLLYHRSSTSVLLCQSPDLFSAAITETQEL